MSRVPDIPAAPVLPPATVGILGGGQLGRYCVMAARTMGYRTMVLEPDQFSPAGAARYPAEPYLEARARR